MHNPDASRIALLRSIIADHGGAMVASFYELLLQDAEAQAFLSHSVVHSRLSASLLEWLKALFDEEDIRTSPQLQGRQKEIGEVHARIKIPLHLVLEGAMAIKSAIGQILADRAMPAHQAIEALQLAHDRVDTAMLMMSRAYLTDTTARARLDEAYRLFSIDQDVSTEKEAQKASLMEWSQNTLFALLRGEQSCLGRLSDSPFGLWLRHRASFMFEKSVLFQDLVAEIQKIDRLLLPQLEAGSLNNRQMETLIELQSAVDRASFLLGELFQSLSAMESGRDPLTRALNRRFLPAILGREIAYANENGSPLCIVLLDVDHFKQINDAHGHQTGDLVLRQLAQIVMDQVRPSDFVFRYGGEEFLIVLNETDVAQAVAIAERIRLALQDSDIAPGGSEGISVTASFGVAVNSGHPDQNYLIKVADQALYAAKANGRNRVEVRGGSD